MKLYWKSVICVAAFIGVALSALAQDAAEEAIIDATIDLARSYMGDAEKLDSIASIQYKGSILYSNGANGSAEIILKKPHYQKFISTVNARRETSGLDRSEGWKLTEELGKNDPGMIALFGVEEILRVQASVQEAFNFYKRPGGRNKTVTHQGRREVEGIECVVLLYDHGDGIRFQRYFDAATGRLVQTVTDQVIFRESGELLVDGIRFPKKLTTIYLWGEGAQSMEIQYTSIELNKDFPREIFKVPSLAK